MTTISQSCRYSRKKAQLVPANQTVERPRSIQPFPPRKATARAIGEKPSRGPPTFLFHQCSSFGGSVVNFNFQHRVVRKQFFCCLLRSTLFRELGFEMPIDDHRVSTRGRDISPPYISGLLFFDAESRFFHVSC
jgi:hypothetical protein